MVEILRVGDLALLQAVAAAAQLGTLVARAPAQKIVARLEHVRLHPRRPAVVARQPVVLAHGPEDGAGLELVAAEVLHETVGTLAREKEVDRPFGQLVPAHGVEELDDRRTLGANGRVPADSGEGGTAPAAADGGEVEVEQAGADPLVDGALGNMDARTGVELATPEAPARLAVVREVETRQGARPRRRQWLVRHPQIEHRRAAGREQHRCLVLRQGAAVEQGHAEDPLRAGQRGESGCAVERLRGDAVQRRRLEPGVARHGAAVDRLDTDAADDLLLASVGLGRDQRPERRGLLGRGHLAMHVEDRPERQSGRARGRSEGPRSRVAKSGQVVDDIVLVAARRTGSAGIPPPGGG